MVNTLDFWAFIIANMSAVVAGGLLTGLSYVAYRRRPGMTSYRLATIGFGFVLLGSLVDPAYLLGWSVDFHLSRPELFILIAIEELLIAAGLGIIFIGITKHDSAASSTGDDIPSSIDGERDWRGHEWSDD